METEKGEKKKAPFGATSTVKVVAMAVPPRAKKKMANAVVHKMPLWGFVDVFIRVI